MKTHLSLVFACCLSFTFAANARSVGTQHPTPEYLEVPGFKDCLHVVSMGTWDSWCLPATQPENCENGSWDRLVEISNDGNLPVCLETVEPEPVR